MTGLPLFGIIFQEVNNDLSIEDKLNFNCFKHIKKNVKRQFLGHFIELLFAKRCFRYKLGLTLCASISFYSGKGSNFNKYSKKFVTDYGVGYDYGSVMHYSSRAFSANGEATIIPLVSISLLQFSLR